jgi:hypothetical protein
MDRANFELLADVRLADLYREADTARLLHAVVRRRAELPVLQTVGGLLIRAGSWLQRLGQVCPDCPAPALS